MIFTVVGQVIWQRRLRPPGIPPRVCMLNPFYRSPGLPLVGEPPNQPLNIPEIGLLGPLAQGDPDDHPDPDPPPKADPKPEPDAALVSTLTVGDSQVSLSTISPLLSYIPSGIITRGSPLTIVIVKPPLLSVANTCPVMISIIGRLGL